MRVQPLVASLVCFVCYLDSTLSSLIPRFELRDPRERAEPIHGIVHDQLGYECGYIVLPGDRHVVLGLGCVKRTGGKAKFYECYYAGDPRSCDWFMHHPVEYFANLARRITSRNRGTCNLIFLSVTHCEHVLFWRSLPPTNLPSTNEEDQRRA